MKRQQTVSRELPLIEGKRFPRDEVNRDGIGTKGIQDQDVEWGAV